MNILSDNKKSFREEYRRRRDAFHSQLDHATRGLAFRRPPSPLAHLFDGSDIVALYSAVGSEAPTARLAEFLAENGKKVAYPLVTGETALEFRAVDSGALLAAGYRDIPEPDRDCPQVTPDIIIAPLIAFDRAMGRLGQGGGFYDRSFAAYPSAVRVGLAWSVQEADEVPMQDHDVPLQMIVTESEIIQRVETTP